MIKKINIYNYLFLKKEKNNEFNKYFFNKFLKIFIILISLIIDFIILKKNKINIKICLCTLGKLENKYAREFVEYYKNYGINKIFIYDNNDINGETFETVLSDYIKKDFVKIINYRGKFAPQLKMLNNCYKTNYKKYDWFIMFDMDEFIYLKRYSNIKLFLINV